MAGIRSSRQGRSERPVAIRDLNPSKEVEAKNDGNELGWDAMIRDARKRIEDLNYSIKVFEKRKAAGDLCPAIKSEGDEKFIQALLFGVKAKDAELLRAK
jgi:hypothetical protein